jgi:hypothetical protein
MADTTTATATPAAPAAPSAAPKATAPVTKNVTAGTTSTTTAELGAESTATAPPDKGATDATGPKRWKLKVGDMEEEYDPANPEHVEKILRYAQLGKGSDKAFKEAKRLRDEAESLKGRFSKDTRRALAELGVDPLAFAVQEVQRQMALEQMSPQERAIAEREHALLSREEQIQAQEEERKSAEQKRLADEWGKRIDGEFVAALQSVAVPKSPRTVARMAELAIKNLEHGFDLPATALAQIVRDEYFAEHNDLYGAMEPDALLSALPKSVVDKLQKALIAKVKAQPVTSAKTEPKTAPPPAKKKPMTEAEYWDHMAQVTGKRR